jgi:hypothetical protein
MQYLALDFNLVNLTPSHLGRVIARAVRQASTELSLVRSPSDQGQMKLAEVLRQFDSAIRNRKLIRYSLDRHFQERQRPGERLRHLECLAVDVGTFGWYKRRIEEALKQLILLHL